MAQKNEANLSRNLVELISDMTGAHCAVMFYTQCVGFALCYLVENAKRCDNTAAYIAAARANSATHPQINSLDAQGSIIETDEQQKAFYKTVMSGHNKPVAALHFEVDFCSLMPPLE